jgi:hypothetical protein
MSFGPSVSTVPFGAAASAAPEPAAVLPRAHARRLREVYRSAGWPCQDGIEVELLAAGLLQRERGPLGHETIRLTDAGIAVTELSLMLPSLDQVFFSLTGRHTEATPEPEEVLA